MKASLQVKNGYYGRVQTYSIIYNEIGVYMVFSFFYFWNGYQKLCFNQQATMDFVAEAVPEVI